VQSLLKNIPLLAKLTDAERAQLGAYLVEKKFNDKDRIITQGELGLGFYIITRGEVVVTLKNEKGVTAELGRLKEGDYFGETALINNAKRGASVTAVGSVSSFYLERANFNALFGQDRLNVQFAKRKAVTAEARSTNAHAGVASTPAGAVKEKNAATVALIAAAISSNVLFMNLDSEHKSQIIGEMYRTEIKEGVSAIKQGEMGDNLYVVESGTFNIFVNGKQVATRGKGTCFGELALMYNSPRAATVTAATHAVVWVVDRFTFRRIVTDLSEKRFGVYVGFLKKVELLQPLAEYERKKIAEALEEVNVQGGNVLFREGDMGDSMYLIYSGELRISKLENGKEKELLRVKEGDYFGERALITNEVRAATDGRQQLHAAEAGPQRILAAAGPAGGHHEEARGVVQRCSCCRGSRCILWLRRSDLQRRRAAGGPCDRACGEDCIRRPEGCGHAGQGLLRPCAAGAAQEDGRHIRAQGSQQGADRADWPAGPYSV